MHNRRETDRRSGQDKVAAPSAPTKSLAETRNASPQEILLNRARRLRHEADDLEALANALPGMMPEGAEQALNHILVSQQRF